MLASVGDARPVGEAGGWRWATLGRPRRRPAAPCACAAGRRDETDGSLAGEAARFVSALRDKEAGDAVHKRRMATLQAQAATRAEEEARHTAAAAQSETQEPRRSWALRAADVAAIDALEQRQWAEKWDAEASALEAALEAPLE